MGVVAPEEIANLIGESVGETHLPSNQHLKNATGLWVAEEVTESGARAEQTTLLPL